MTKPYLVLGMRYTVKMKYYILTTECRLVNIISLRYTVYVIRNTIYSFVTARSQFSNK